MTNGEHIVAGEAAEIFARDDGHVLKLYRGEDSANKAELEANHIHAAKKAGLNVPTVKEIIEVDGCHGIIFERIEGPTLRQKLINKPRRLIPLARQLAEVHVEMHACSAPATFRVQRAQIEQKITHTPLLSDEAKKTLLSDLAQLPTGNAICHGNFHPGNLLLSYNGPVVVNWLDATQGNPYLDIAHTTLRLQPLPLSPAVGPSLRQFTIATVRLFCAVYLQTYTALCPISYEQLDVWRRLVAALQLVELDDFETTLIRRESTLIPPIEVEALR